MIDFFVNAYRVFSTGQVARILTYLEIIMLTIQDLQAQLADAAAKLNEADAKITELTFSVDKNTGETRLLIGQIETLTAALASSTVTLPDDVSAAVLALGESATRIAANAGLVGDKLAVQDSLVQD